MKKWMLAFALTLAFSLSAVAQQSGSTSSDQSSSQSSATSNPSSTSSGSMGSTGAAASSDQTATSGKHKSEVGCLEQGSTPGTYMLKDAKHPSGINVSYSGSEDLSKHIGHKVKVTGSMSGDTLNATNVKHISETCSPESAGTSKHHHGSQASSSGTGDMSGASSGSTSSPSGTGTTGTGTSNPK